MNLSLDPEVKEMLKILADKKKQTVAAYVTQMVIENSPGEGSGLRVMPDQDEGRIDQRKAK